MTIGPNTTGKMRLREWVTLTAAVVGLALAASASLQAPTAEIRSVKEKQESDQLLIDGKLATVDVKLEAANARLEKIDKWQEDALSRSQRLFDLLYEIKGSVSRIEGQIAK